MKSGVYAKRELCLCGHLREAHNTGTGRCIDWQGDGRNCDCHAFVEHDAKFRRMLYAADCASRRDASARRVLNLAARGTFCRGRDLRHMVERAAHGWAFVGALALEWMLTAAALLVVVVAGGCSSSHLELDAGDVAELVDAGAGDALYSADTSDSSADAGDVAELEAACRRAAIAYEAADYRLGCHRVSSCCTITHACPVDVDVDACVRARETAATCAELEAPACAFAPTFAEGGL